MSTPGTHHVVASAVRVEHVPDQDRVFLVFEIVDEHFKQKIKTDWLRNVDLQLSGKDLITYDV